MRISLLRNILATIAASAMVGAENMTVNPSFEQTDANGASGWNIREARTGAGARIDATAAHSGKSSLLLEQTNAIALPEGATEAPNLVRFLNEKRAGGFTIVTQDVPVEGGKYYNFSFWFKASGLLKENRSDLKSGYANFSVSIFWLNENRKSVNEKTYNSWVMNQQVDAVDWVKVENVLFIGGGQQRPYLAPEGAKIANIRFALAANAPNVTPKAWIDDVVFSDASDEHAGASSVRIAVPNSGFEEDDGSVPKHWKSVGSSDNKWAGDVKHSGKKSVSVTTAGMGNFSGWETDISVKNGFSYKFSGWIKGGDLSPNGPVGGGALVMQFLDKDGQAVGVPVISKAVGPNTDWSSIETEKIAAPANAAVVRLTVGLQFCNGTAWFDDMILEEEDGTQKVVMVRRLNPQPDDRVVYAKNLLSNGDVEEGEGGKPKGWTYVGRSEKDWTSEEIATFHREGRVQFGVGRGKGEWSRQTVYSGKGALLNISIDPPLSRNMQWYGRNPVEGFWLSDPAPCEAGKQYIAGAWIRPGAAISSPWYGPLEIQFFNEKGAIVKAANDAVRAGLNNVPPGTWTYWTTLPYIAPEGAKTMRLRFGQELCAYDGGWGRTHADNIALWECPIPAKKEMIRELGLRSSQFRKWFQETHKKVKPPYLSSPAEITEHESCFGFIKNSVPGNIFRERDQPVELKVAVGSYTGEKRKLRIKFDRFDHLGNLDTSAEIPEFEVGGYSSQTAGFVLPPTRKYGTFYLEGKILEGEAVVGSANGRYAVLPRLDRPRVSENSWGVTLLGKMTFDGRPYEKEVGELLTIAGFGVAWVRLWWVEGDNVENIGNALKEIAFNKESGMRSVLQLMGCYHKSRPIEVEKNKAYGKAVAEIFRGKVAAYGNFDIEQANHRTEKEPGFRPIINGKYLSDEEYDQVLAAIYDGIRSVDKETPVLIGNIATDPDANTIKRLYGKPAQGRFDGAIVNAYAGQIRVIAEGLKAFDSHGDTQKTIWYEEGADQRAPIQGSARRYGEVDGAYNMVRTWLGVKCKGGPRVKAITLWGFLPSTMPADIVMVTDELQPRPQFAAHAVMADATADAIYVADRSRNNVTVFEWKRGDGPLFTLWADAGERSATFEVSSGSLTVMDVMGNQTVMKANDGIVSLKITPVPLYVFGGGNGLKISSRIGARLFHGSKKSGEAAIRFEMKNNDKTATSGNVLVTGPVKDGKTKIFNLAPGETGTYTFSVSNDLPAHERKNFSAECTTTSGAVYIANASLNFAQAVRADAKPALDGTWKGWEKAQTIEFGFHDSQIFIPPGGTDHKYKGLNDITGIFRALWDDQFLYLGVKAEDDAFYPQTERGRNGFMGDSIEFAFQPENNLSRDAKYWEYELYLPNGQPPYAASRRFPAPQGMITTWESTIKPNGVGGDCYYQVAIPWKDIGLEKPTAGKTISFALVLNDADPGERLSGGYRGRVRWFAGLDLEKNPEKFGDLTLVE